MDNFDIAHMKRGHWLVVGGAAVTLIAVLFFSWYSVSYGGISIGNTKISGGSVSVSAWDTGTIGKFAVLGALLLAAVAVGLVLKVQDQIPFPLSTAALVLGAFVCLMVLIKFLQHHSYTSFGLYLTFVAAAVATYGGYELEGHNAFSGGAFPSQNKGGGSAGPTDPGAGAGPGDAV